MTKRSQRSRKTAKASMPKKASGRSKDPTPARASEPRGGGDPSSGSAGTTRGARRGGGAVLGSAARILDGAWFWPALIFALAFVLRLIYVLQVRHTPFFQTLGLDAKFYDQWAREIARGQAPGDAFFMSPLYPYFLAIVYRLFGRDLMLVRLIQAGLGSLSAVLVYHLGRTVFDRRVGVLAGLLAATYGALIFYDGSVLMTPLLVILNLVALVLLLRGDESRRPAPFVLAGVAIGVSAVGRAAVLLFVPVALAWVWAGRGAVWKGAAGGRPVKGRDDSSRGGGAGAAALRNRRLAAVGLFLLGVALIVVPITVRNYVVSHDFVPITSNGGLNFYIGNSEISTGGYVKPEGLDIVVDPDGASIAEREVGRELRPSEVSEYWYGRAKRFIATSPGAWLKLTLRKLSFTMSSYELPQLENYYFQKRYSALLSFPLPGFAVLAPLGLVGLAISLKRRRAQLLGLFFLTYTVSIVLFFVVARYRLPAVPALLAGAAYLLFEAWRWVREKRWPTFAGAAVALAVLYLLVNANLYRIDTAKAFAQPHFRLGIVYGDRGLRDEAIAEYREAIAIDPGYPKSYLNLGALLAEAGRQDEAIDAFRSAIAIDPSYTAARVDLAMVYGSLGEHERAIAEIDSALAIDPDDAMALKERGIALYRLGRLEEAAGVLRTAAERDRDGSEGAEIGFYLGLIERPERGRVPLAAEFQMARAESLARAARPVEAVRALEEAARLAPESGEPLRRLALLKRDMGLLDEAAELMGEALRIDPALEQGHFIMGVLLNETGQHDLAIHEYEAQTRIDPGFAPAHLNLAVIYEFYRANPNRAAYHYRKYLELGGEPVESLERALRAVD